jgi:uncharacterized surface protein with fasciclin (FAS1) repeats
MTYLGPFTQATLIYEPDEVSIKGQVATPGTILDYVAKNLPHFLPIIKNAGKTPFYNSIERSYTLFAPSILSPDFSHLDPNTSIQILKMSTVPGIITTDMLSNNQIIFPLDHPRNNLHVTKFKDGEIRVWGKTLIAGDIICKNGIIHLLDGVLWPTY